MKRKGNNFWLCLKKIICNSHHSTHPRLTDSQFHMLLKCSAFPWVKPSSATWSLQSTRGVGSWAPFPEAQGALALLCLLPAKLVLPGDARATAEMLWECPEWPHTLNAWDVLEMPGLAATPHGGGYPWEIPKRSRAASYKHNVHAALTPQLHTHILVPAKWAAAFENIPLNVPAVPGGAVPRASLVRELFSLPR